MHSTELPTPAFAPVAIVGVATALPGAGDLDAFAAALEERRDLVGPVPADRRADAGLGGDDPLAECALLDRVDAFDHAFFGLSLREARQMDPQQRALLELSCRAIWDGGRSLAQLRGSRTAVVFGAAAEEYSTLIDPADQPMVTGLLPGAQAGRVAHALDLRGPASTVDTACSSSLSAVLDACRRLGAGEVEWALAGGVRLLPVPPTPTEPGAESIVSPGGRSRSFDAAADGTGLGEGGAVFLLKLLSRAQADGDPVHAVIIGGAANHDGGRSNGFAAPSAEAQEELLLTAWRSAGCTRTRSASSRRTAPARASATPSSSRR
ncbi:polyketide synthase [Actinokineospora soli]|uniref:Polyketide synthase n=1 Tax=Actinokineospora soli TaxID=1048753 RepID=A0ABW2TMT2_9PSEU